MKCQHCGAMIAPDQQFCRECGSARPRLPSRFEETEKQYFALRARRDSGQISTAEYEAALERLVLRDEEGIEWMLGVESGEWYRWSGKEWQPANPPTLDRPAQATPSQSISSQSKRAASEAAWQRPAVLIAAGVLALSCVTIGVYFLLTVSASPGGLTLTLFGPGSSSGALTPTVQLAMTIPTLPVRTDIPEASLPPPMPTAATATRLPDPTNLPAPGPSPTAARSPSTSTASPTRIPTNLPVSPTPTRMSAASSPCPNPGGSTLFSDGFANPGSGWTVYRGSDYEHYYENGEFHFAAMKSNFVGAAWLLLRDQGTRYIVSVRSRRVGGPDMNNYGLVFGGFDDRNFYALRISDSGSYRLAKKVQDQWQDLVAWTKTPLVNVGGWNTLSAVVQDSRITVCSNGQALKTLDDAAPKAGRVGLIAGAFDEPIHIHFDDFLVTKLP